MRRITRTIIAGTLAASILGPVNAVALTPSSDLAADIATVRTNLPSSGVTFVDTKNAVRAYAVANGLRMRASSTVITLWDPRHPGERASITVKTGRFSVSYQAASVTSTNKRELELYKALDATTRLVKSKGSVMFAKAEKSTFAPTLPKGSTTARRDALGNVSIVSDERSRVLIGTSYTRTNPRTWTAEERAVIVAAGIDPDAQLLRSTVGTEERARVVTEYTTLVSRTGRNLIAQAFDSAPSVSVSKTNSTTVYRVRSKVSPTATPGARGMITTSFVVRAGRITLILLTPDNDAARYGTSARISYNSSTGTVRGISGTVVDNDRIVNLPELRLASARRQASEELQNLLRTVVVADDATALQAALARYAADPRTASQAPRLALHGRAVQWTNDVLTMCGRLDLVAGVVIAEKDCTSAGYPRS